MIFGFILFTRLLFITCMVFIIGYVFGDFSAKPALKTITKIASIVLIILFIAFNAFTFRTHGGYSHWPDSHWRSATPCKDTMARTWR